METVDSQNLTGIDRIVADADYNRFSVISVLLLIVGCLGGINVGVGGLESTWQLIITIIPTRFIMTTAEKKRRERLLTKATKGKLSELEEYELRMYTAIHMFELKAGIKDEERPVPTQEEDSFTYEWDEKQINTTKTLNVS